MLTHAVLAPVYAAIAADSNVVLAHIELIAELADQGCGLDKALQPFVSSIAYNETVTTGEKRWLSDALAIATEAPKKEAAALALAALMALGAPPRPCSRREAVNNAAELACKAMEAYCG